MSQKIIQLDYQFLRLFMNIIDHVIKIIKLRLEKQINH